MNRQTVNVLTRTSGRPKFFYFNHKSVRTQDYPKVVHHVSYDDQQSYDYVKTYSDVKSVEVNRIKRVNGSHFPYNHYCNALMNGVKDGWIMFLDDDDVFMSSESVSKIMSRVVDENSLMLWKVKAGNQIIPKRCFGKTPLMSDVSGIGFMFHSKHVANAQWPDRRGGDFKVISHLYNMLKPVWIDEVLTRTGYTSVVGGFGRRMDSATLNADELQEYENHQSQPVMVKKSLNISLKVQDTPSHESEANRNTHGRGNDQGESDHDQDESDHDQDESDHDQDESDHDQDESDDDQDESDDDQDESDHEQDESDDDQNEGDDDQNEGDDDQEGSDDDQDESDDEQNESDAEQDDSDDEHEVIHPKIRQLLELFVDDEKLMIVPRKLMEDLIQSVNSLITSSTKPTAAPPPAPKPLSKGLPTIGEVVKSEEKKSETLQSMLDDFEKNNQEPMDSTLRSLDDLFDMVYFINATNKLSDATIRSKFGILKNYQMIHLDHRKNTKTSQLKHQKIVDVVQEARRQGYKHILIMQDDTLIHKNFYHELSHQMSKLNDYRLLYLGAIHHLEKNLSDFDPDVYLEYYPDLERAGVRTAAQLKSHWTRYGQKERRIGSRMTYHPAGKVQGTFALALHQSVYDEILDSRDNLNIFNDLQKKYAQDCYVMRPNLVINNIGDRQKKKNKQKYLEHQWVPEFYQIFN